MFALCVDDFGIKYHSKQDLQHLITTLQKHYEISIDEKGKNYCGLRLEWNYKESFIDISMPLYVCKALKKYNHPTPTKPQYSPHRWTRPTYGKSLQLAPVESDEPPLDKYGKRRIQLVVGIFLYYGRAVESAVLTAFNDITTMQAKPTINTLK